MGTDVDVAGAVTTVSVPAAVGLLTVIVVATVALFKLVGSQVAFVTLALTNLYPDAGVTVNVPLPLGAMLLLAGSKVQWLPALSVEMV